MSHYAVIAPPLYSHFSALQALACTLLARGHQITFIHQSDARNLLSDARIGFHVVGRDSHPPGSLARTLRRLASPSGLLIHRVINDLASTTEMLCCALPEAIAQLEVEGLIVDQMEAAGGLVAEALGLPFVSVACALPVNREPGLPLPVMPFNYATDERARRLYDMSSRVHDWLMRRQGAVIAQHARRFGLPPRQALHECLSPLAQISQTLPLFDFPRHQLPACYHAPGPLRAPALSSPQPMPWPGGSATPRVYASLGTLQGHRFALFRTFARACRRAGASLVVAHCGGLTPQQEEALRREGAAWVTDFVDQPAILAQAQVVITHGGLNTVMDAITHRVPILCVPIAFDQPGVAARVVYSGIGRRISRFASSKLVADHLHALLTDDRYRRQLAAAQQQLRHAGGVEKAADIVERALGTQQPVLAETQL